jgi:MYXO-CTERM domain-containing protein
MGLVPASAVPPFGVLTSPTVVSPAGATDPYNTGQPITGITLPWFGTAPLTVRATRNAFTIDDVIAATGTRVPAAGQGPTSLKVAFVLVVKQDSTAADVAAAQAVFDPISAELAPAFARATGNRATLEVITQPRGEGGADAGAAEGGAAADAADDAGADAAASAEGRAEDAATDLPAAVDASDAATTPPPATKSEGCACSTVPGGHAGSTVLLLLVGFVVGAGSAIRRTTRPALVRPAPAPDPR